MLLLFIHWIYASVCISKSSYYTFLQKINVSSFESNAYIEKFRRKPFKYYYLLFQLGLLLSKKLLCLFFQVLKKTKQTDKSHKLDFQKEQFKHRLVIERANLHQWMKLRSLCAAKVLCAETVTSGIIHFRAGVKEYTFFFQIPKEMISSCISNILHTS